MKYDRTRRILTLYHIFYNCPDISFKGIRSYISEDEAVDRTIIRDVRLLKEAGLIKTRYSKKCRAYVPLSGYSFIPREYQPPKLPENKTQRVYMEKIIRLCTLMTDVVMCEEEDPIKWYREKYPQLSERTRQRDFKTVCSVGYKIQYLPADWDGRGRYGYEYPDGF